MVDSVALGPDSQPGRRPERLRLPEPALSEAKRALCEAERRMSMSGKRLAEALHVSPRTWRSYKDPAEPGPPPDLVRRLDALLAERDETLGGQLTTLWGLPVVEEGRGPVLPSSETSPRPLDEGQANVPRRRRLALLAITLMAILTVGIAVRALVDQADDRATTTSAEITIYNKVVLDETRVREDVPAYLTISPRCLAKSTCGIEGTDVLETGMRVTAVCQTEGSFVTNRFGDTPNDENFDSTRWYGINLNGKFGYLSEVWVAKEHRGGLDLRSCEPSG